MAMKPTRFKISVSQDGLMPEETTDIATVDFPNLPKKLIKALGFERVDANTYVGVVPVFVKLGGKEQEIEVEIGVDVPEMRSKVLELIRSPFTATIEDAEGAEAEGGKVIEINKKGGAKRAKKTARGRKKGS